ncbi:calcium-binding protein [Methylobacterium sp. Leaf85]|uniref:calcium-binding protein n=1 Tax=Methylobacterium sp. Leaf85 TaxID=1736241 RepID=UPI000AAC8C78|nr:calcium-binding protein [Methylobacterium sp. Leaf85]
MGTKYVRADIEATTAGTPGVELSSASTGLTDVYVYSDVNVISSYDDGIRGFGSEHDALIGGYIVGDRNGIRLGDSSSIDHDQRVLIYSSGVSVGINNAGVAVYGYNSVVTINGEVQGDIYGILMSGISNKYKSTVNNDGEVFANSYGVAHSLSGGDTEGLVLRNTGYIEGGLFSFFGGDNNIASDRIVNSGRMVGDVSMGGGDDVYDARQGGTVEGTVFGGLGDDRFVGTSNDDIFVGDAGNDRLDGGRGYDTLTGGLGDDTYILRSTALDVRPDPDADPTIYGDTVIELKNQGIDTIYANFEFDLANYINVENGVLNALSRNDGDSWDLFGTAVSNSITGNDGDNRIDGREGADQLIGLGGNDTYYVDNSLDKVVEGANGGTDTIITSVTYSLAGLQVENITINGAGNINITGNSLENVIYASPGSNVINSGGGSDAITLSGASDISDKDVLVFSSALGPDNFDRISQFNGMDQDMIHLSSSIFKGLSQGALSAQAYQSGSTIVAATSDVRIIYSTSTQSLYYDSDGSGSAAAVPFALLYYSGAGTTPGYEDFLIV